MRVTWGRRACSVFSLGHARKQGCAQQPNAGGEPPRHVRHPHAKKLPLARSAPLLCWVAGDRRGHPAFPVTVRHHPAGSHSGRRGPPCPGDRGRWRLTRHLAHRWWVRDTTVSSTTTWQRDAPVVCLALPAAPTTATGPRRTPPRRAADADHAMAQDAALPDNATPWCAVTGTRSWPRASTWAPARASARPPPPPPLLGPGTTTTVPHAGGCSRRTHQRARGTTGRHGWQHNRCLGPRLPSSVGRASAAMPKRTQCV